MSEALTSDLLARIARARNVARQAPDDAEAAFQLCSLLVRTGNAEAQAVLNDCLTRHPGPAPGWREVGEAFLARQQPAAALVCFARASMTAALALRCGLIARDLGQVQQALAFFTETVRLNPASVRGWFLLGTCAEDRRDFGTAAAAYRRVLALDPARAEAAVNLGIVLQAAGDLAEAKQFYGVAVQTNPATFGRIAQALPGAPKGELWLDLTALRRSLAG